MKNDIIEKLAEDLGADTPTLLYMEFYKGKSIMDLCESKGGEDIDMFNLWTFFIRNVSDKYKVDTIEFNWAIATSGKFELISDGKIKMI